MADEITVTGAESRHSPVSLRQYLTTHIGQAITVYLMGVFGQEGFYGDFLAESEDLDDIEMESIPCERPEGERPTHCPCPTVVITGTLVSVGTDFIEICRCHCRPRKHCFLIPFCAIGAILTRSR